MTRIYVATDPAAEIKAIANTSMPKPLIGIEGTYYPTAKDMLLVSYDGTTFHTVLFTNKGSGSDNFKGEVSHPALDIDDMPIQFAEGVMTYGTVEYVLDETATVDTVVTKPIMHIFKIVQTHGGYYVSAQNKLGLSHDYLDGKPLVLVNGLRVRSGDIVEKIEYVGHLYVVQGDHMDSTSQTATFDGQPATILDPKDYVVKFADDLSTVWVTKK